jgi:hypothetical protein
MQYGAPIPADVEPATIPQFSIGSSPFVSVLERSMPVICRRANYGFKIATDDLNNRAFVADIAANSSASKIFSTPKATNNKLRGAYIIRINNTPVFTASDVLHLLRSLADSATPSIEFTFAPERRATSKQIRRAARELNLFNPIPPIDTPLVHSISVSDLRVISAVRHPNLSFSETDLPISHIHAGLHAIRSQATTDAELSLGHFTRRKLKQLDTWPLWHAGEFKQLDQFHALGMYGDPIPRPPTAIVLRQHWQYHIKRDGTCRARNCCDGSPRAAPALHKLVETYSSCVEQPVQRLFFALAAQLNYQVFGGDAKDAFAHSPPPITQRMSPSMMPTPNGTLLSLQWAVSIGRIDITTSVMTLRHSP